MMILAAVYDRATEAHGPVMTFRTRNEAIRTFKQEVNNTQGQINANVTDYELVQLAHYNEETGELGNDKQTLARAEDLLGA